MRAVREVGKGRRAQEKKGKRKEGGEETEEREGGSVGEKEDGGWHSGEQIS